jgi:S1/P1 Nuclease
MARLRTLRVLAATVLAAAIVLAMPALPAAWGNRGHIAVARLAKSRLTPGASSAVADLLGTQSMDDFDVALWADEVRKTTRPDTFNSYEQVKADNKISSMERKTALGFAERQIAKGGVRLAAVLNRALEQP